MERLAVADVLRRRKRQQHHEEALARRIKRESCTKLIIAWNVHDAVVHSRFLDDSG